MIYEYTSNSKFLIMCRKCGGKLIHVMPHVNQDLVKLKCNDCDTEDVLHP